MMDLTPERRANLRAIAEAATPGPRVDNAAQIAAFDRETCLSLLAAADERDRLDIVVTDHHNKLGEWQTLTGFSHPSACKAELDQLRMSLAGRDKAIALFNAGYESTCEDRDALKQRVRTLEAEITRVTPYLVAHNFPGYRLPKS